MAEPFVRAFRGGETVQKKVWLRPLRVAQRLDCSSDHVYDLIRAGELEAVRLGPRSFRISEDSLNQFLLKSLVEPSEKI